MLKVISGFILSLSCCLNVCIVLTDRVCCRSLFLAPREKPRNWGLVRDGLHGGSSGMASIQQTIDGSAENQRALWVRFFCVRLCICVPFCLCLCRRGRGPSTVAPLGFCVSRSVLRCAVCWDLASRRGYAVMTPSQSVSSDSRDVLRLCFTLVVKVSVHSLSSVLGVWSFISGVLYKMQIVSKQLHRNKTGK